MTQNGIVNPYIAGSPITDSAMFFGREDVFDFVRSTLRGRSQGNVVVLYGQPRCGKTSILYRMGAELGPAYVCALVDLLGLSLDGLATFLRQLAGQIRRELRRQLDVELPRPAADEFGHDPREAFEEFLEHLWPLLDDRRLVVMLDESGRLDEQVRAGRLDPGVYDYLRHLMQYHDRLGFVITMSTGVEENAAEYARMLSIAAYKRISFLGRESAIRLIVEPARGRYDLDGAAVRRLVDATAGHPYFTQLVCHRLFTSWLTAPRPSLGIGDVQEALADAVEIGSPNLTSVWLDASPTERAVLATLATLTTRPGGGASAGRILNTLARRDLELPEGEVVQAIRDLVARDVLLSTGRGFRYAVDPQRSWVLRHRRLEWVREEIRTGTSESPLEATGTRQNATAARSVPTAPRDSYHAAELAKLYHFPHDLDGTGQRIAMIQLAGGYRMSDLTEYFGLLELPVPRIVDRSVRGASNSPGSTADAQAVADLEITGALAPGASFEVYFAPNTDAGFVEALNTAVDQSPGIILVNWGEVESAWTSQAISAFERTLRRAADRRITVIAGSGERGAQRPATRQLTLSYPACSQWVLCCGGTTLAAPTGKTVQERVWNSGEAATSGGFSTRFPRPEWQEATVARWAGTEKSPAGRGVPDVAADADPNSGYRVLLDGKQMVLGGTTTAAALWAALVARINQGLDRPVGYLNPLLYTQIGPRGLFRDITLGYNGTKDRRGYSAVPGWDPCTGWGAPDGDRLLLGLRDHTG